MHKTGSSAIQNILSSLPRTNNYNYLNISSSPNQSSAIVSIFGNESENYQSYKKRKINKETIEKQKIKYRDNFIRQIKNNKSENLFLSAESLTSNWIDIESINTLKNIIQENSYSIKIVAYVREPSEFQKSMFLHKLKGGLAGFNIEKNKPHYQKRFEKFDQVFGETNVILWKYDKNHFPDNCVVKDFCKKMNIDLTVNTDVYNEGFTKEAACILYSYLKYGKNHLHRKTSFKEIKALVKALRSLDGTKFRFSDELIRQYYGQNHEDITWMEERLGEKFVINKSTTGDVIEGENDLLKIDSEIFEKFIVKFHEQNKLIINPELNYKYVKNPEEAAIIITTIKNKLASKILKEKVLI